MTFETYAEAAEWARDHWTDVQIPFRLHERGFDAGGSPEMSAAFLRFLESSATHKVESRTFMDKCRHGRQGVDDRECPDCANTGYVAKHAEVFRYPMAMALKRLADDEPTPLRPHQPTPATLVVLLERNAWDLALTCHEFRPVFAYEMMEALALLSLRKLYGRYAVRPIAKVGWVSKSEAQQNAESSVVA